MTSRTLLLILLGAIIGCQFARSLLDKDDILLAYNCGARNAMERVTPEQENLLCGDLRKRHNMTIEGDWTK